MKAYEILLLSNLIISFLLGAAYGDMFTAIAEMEKILQVEHEVAQDLKEYINKEEERLKLLKSIADDFEKHSTEAESDPESYLSNPVNAYLLIKRFTSDWNEILEQNVKSSAAQEFIEKINSKTLAFPTSEDLKGTGVALFRIQDTYALSANKLARGDLKGVSKSAELSDEDCFLLGNIAYNNYDYYHTILWINEALSQLERYAKEGLVSDSEYERKKANFLDYLSFSYYKQGNLKKAENLTKELLQLDPDHLRAQGNMKHFEKFRAEENLQEDQQQDEEFNPRHTSDYKMSEEFQNYEKLCRGEKTRPTYNEHKLTCQYKRHHPVLYLRPAKEEMVNWDPKMYMYHGIVTDSQIKQIKTLGKPRLDRSVVFHKTDDGTTTPQDYRISKTGWLRDIDGESIKKFSTVAAAISNLTLEYAEEMQVLNYGIGGHYEPHYDFATNREPTEYEMVRGNRIATFICYLSDVAEGGATVFPSLGVSYFPKKGNCAFWYNLMRSGNGDMRTRHAACPVLSGVKWACNKWFRERGQEFIRPCTTSMLD